MNRVTEDVSRVRMYLGPAIMYTINTLVLFILIIVAMFNVNGRLTLFSILPLPLLAIIIYYVHNIINQRSEKIQEQLSSMSSFVQESFSGIRVVKAYVREDDIRRKFNQESEDYKTHSMSLVQVQALFYPIMLLLVGLSTIATVYIGGIEVMNGNITSGNIAEFIVYVSQLTFPVTSLGWVTSLIQRASASQKRINEFLNTKPEIESYHKKEIDISGAIEFKDVSFTYPDTGIKAIKNISFKVEKGQFLAIIGRTGSGKSTIANLIMRMYDSDKGEILIDNQEIRDLNLTHYRNQIGFVPQEVFLFSDSIYNNIAFGLSVADQSQVEQAAKDAALYDNIQGFDQGFQTMIGERGVRLSGCLRQRIGIARALYHDPQLDIFDEATSALDYQTEKEVMDAINNLDKKITKIIITHRLNSVTNCDIIYKLENNQIFSQKAFK
jgi:ATP-binding cassette subfamily B protein